MSEIVLLGPQIHQPNVAHALSRVAPDGPVAVIACGWQEAEEEEADELQELLNRPTVKLLLHRRGDHVFRSDPEFFDAYRERQNELHQLQDLYRLRLGHARQAAQELLRREAGEHLIDPEREAAIEAVRTLDQHHLSRLREVHEKFEAEWRPRERAVIARHCREIAERLEGVAALVVAGGHVAVVLYRLRLFDVPSLLGELPVVAWSAGAMALAERVVLFHDSPPQGQGNPEILENGVGLARSVLPFPHARRRLRLDDPIRISLMARRFAPLRCVAMDEGALLHCRDDSWSAGERTLQLSLSGELVGFNS